MQILAPRGGHGTLTLDDLYRTHAPGALRFALMLTGEQALAEDLVQEAFIRVAAKLDELRDPAAFRAYLTRAVANLAKSHFRHRQVEIRHQRALDARSLVVAPVEPADDELLVALRRLPMAQRAVLVLRYCDDFSNDDIADLLGVPVGTVKSQISRGLARLRKEYGGG